MQYPSTLFVFAVFISVAAASSHLIYIALSLFLLCAYTKQYPGGIDLEVKVCFEN